MYPELWNWIQILFFAAFTCLPPTPHPPILIDKETETQKGEGSE